MKSLDRKGYASKACWDKALIGTKSANYIRLRVVTHINAIRRAYSFVKRLAETFYWKIGKEKKKNPG